MLNCGKFASVDGMGPLKELLDRIKLHNFCKLPRSGMVPLSWLPFRPLWQ